MRYGTIKIRGFLISAFCLLTANFVAQAATVTAVTCNYGDVNAVINGPTHMAANGDTINIPAGTCTWTSTLQISGVGFTITGAGTPNTLPSQFGAGTSATTLIDNAAAPLIRMTAIPYGQTMRVSLLNVQPVSGAGANTIWSGFTFVGVCTISGCPSIRMDNITFPVSWDGPLSGGLTIANNVFGVMDHNTASGNSNSVGPPLVQLAYSSWQGIGADGDNSFAASDTYGTDQVLYLENNFFSTARGTENDASDTGLGGNRVVCRYNTFSPQAGSGLCSSHGTSWLGRFRGQRQVEVYRNTVSCPLCDAGTAISSGVGLIFQNTWTGNWNKLVTLDLPRGWQSIPPWYYCDGAQPYDTNDATTYASGVVTTGGTTTLSDSSKNWTANQWAGSVVTNGTPYSIHDVTQDIGSEIISNTATQYTLNPQVANAPHFTLNVNDSYQIRRATLCMDQPGRSGGTLYSGATPAPSSAANQTLDPVYEWADTSSDNASPILSQSVRLLANHDFYNETANQAAQSNPTTPFNGAAGTGHGSLANRPTTCTSGVAYWATDQGNWNQSGIGGQGELFICATTNTWTLHYTPYTYPHPLTSGTLPPPPPLANACDVNSDGLVNAADVQQAVNQALGTIPCGTADLQNNGTCTVVDVQRVVNAALGGTCVTGQ